MKYRNVKTGAVVDVDSELGGVWEPVKALRPDGTTRGRKSKKEPKDADPEKEEKE